MRIGIEAQRIFRKNKHGMDYVVLQEIKELQKMDTKDEYFIFVAPGEDRCLEDTSNVHIIEIGGGFYPLWEQFTLPRAVKRLKRAGYTNIRSIGGLEGYHGEIIKG